ncbi:MAG: hypothetical protein GDA52_05295 [Rhodobacteraceae bacterium]|nr:hypothetical protein [Paracoccaceae bacterium]
MTFGVLALSMLPHARILVYDDRVEVKAVSESIQEHAALEATLNRERPDNVRIIMDISAPRPVITPFTLLFVRTPEGAWLETCSADTEASRRLILRAAQDAGLTEPAECKIGIGAPGPQWA